MTTQVRIFPAGHDVSVDIVNDQGEAQPQVILKAGSQARDFYIHGSLALTVMEVQTKT